MTSASAKIDSTRAGGRLHLVTQEPQATPDELLVSAGRGDREAFAAFYDQTAPTIYGLARRVVRDPQMAQDVVQEAMVEAWRTAPRFDPARGRAISWIVTIAHRRAIDRVRSEQSRRDREVATSQTAPSSSSGEEISARMLQEENRHEIAAALASLTETQRQVIELAFYDGHTYREVADLLGIPIGTAKTRIRDGLIKLRDAVVSSGRMS